MPSEGKHLRIKCFGEGRKLHPSNPQKQAQPVLYTQMENGQETLNLVTADIIYTYSMS